MKHPLRVFFCIALMCLSTYSTAFAKLYRNTEYQFSIEIPDYMEYRTPRGPNVKMSASAKEGTPNMNVIVKPSMDFAYSNDDVLYGMFERNQQYISESFQLVNYGIIDIPEHRVLCTIWNKKYTYPTDTFYLTVYMFEFVTNYKYYTISYFLEPETEPMYEKMIIHSIGSFVDETGWY